MLGEPDRVRLQHMLDAARIAVHSAEGRRREDLDDEDDLLVHGLIRLVGVVGEAASQVSDAAQNEVSDISWSEIIGMRNRLVHGYFDINLDILWATVQKSLPDLIQRLERALSGHEGG